MSVKYFRTKFKNTLIYKELYSKKIIESSNMKRLKNKYFIKFRALKNNPKQLKNSSGTFLNKEMKSFWKYKKSKMQKFKN